MKNADEILKKILLNMKYDSSKSLRENKEFKDDMLKEDVNDNPPNSQQIPITMNQIMQFQKYIWGVVEKNVPKIINTCRSKDKKTDCAHNSILCPSTKKPCWRKDAVDGMWGGSTIIAWNKYNRNYKLYNPKWWVDDVKTGVEIRGQEIPITSTQTKNFQKWYLEQIEKVKPNNNGLYVTKLCNSPCKYNQAVDGVFGSTGSNTKNLWKIYKDLYVKSNPNWYRNVDFNQDIVRSEERIDKISKTFVFTSENPSGWNQTTPIPNIATWIVTNKNKLFKFNKESTTKIAKNYGWDVNTKLFPTPKLYTEADFALFMPEGGKEELSKIKNEKQEWYTYLQQNKSDRLGSGGSFERQTSSMTGIPTRGESLNSDWEERIKKAKGPQSVAAENWNQNFKWVTQSINEKCGRPLAVYGVGDYDGENPVYITYNDICLYAGGLWVWNVGQGPNAYCGCRVMSKQNGLIGEQLFSVKGPDGKEMTVQIDFKSSMVYQTPGGTKDNEEYEVIHEVLSVVELGLLAVAFVSGPFSPLFFGLSALSGVIDAGVYYKQGDKYMGTMMLALSLIGFDDFVTLVKWTSSSAKTIGKEGLISLAKKKLSKEVLSKTEQLTIKEIETAIYKSQIPLNTALKIKMGTEFITTGVYSTSVKNKWGWKEFFDIFYKINKKLGGIPGFVVKVGGVSYTTDQLYLAFYGNDVDREYSSFGQLFDYFKTTPESKQLEDAQQNAFQPLQKKMLENAETLLTSKSVDVMLNFDYGNLTPIDELENYYKSKNSNLINKITTEKETQQKNHKFTQSPSLIEIESGESTLSWGVSGDSVNEIQRLLNQNGYEVDITGIFDWNTNFMIFSFQGKNDLNQTGVVDTQTLLKLKDSEISCNDNINNLKSSGWVEITKINYLKKLEITGNLEKLKKISCNNVVKYLFNSEQSQQNRQIGQSPILKTIVDNPNLQEIYNNFSRMV